MKRPEQAVLCEHRVLRELRDPERTTNTGLRTALLISILVTLGVAVSAQTLPNPKEMSGSILPVTDLPAGSVSVRVIRGSFDKNIAGQPVEFTIDGNPRTVSTDAGGRAQVSGLRQGARLRAVAVVDGERLESQDATIGTSGLRIILVATDPAASAGAADDATLSSAAPVTGVVVLGPESRVIAEMSDDRLNVYYVLDIVNTAQTPVDIGGPLIFELPHDARGASVLQGSSKQATAKGPRLTVTGPFAPGSTPVQVGYELPYSGGTARLEQQWPAALEGLTLIMPFVAGVDFASPQIAAKRQVSDQGRPLLVATGPAIPAGRSLSLDITGLPHHPLWPRYLALTLASAITATGLWAAFVARPRRQLA